MVTYNRTFQHQDWIDGQDIVQAGGERGFNSEFHALEAEFDNLSPVIAQLTAGLGAFQPVGAGGAVAYSAGNVGIGAIFATTPPTPPTLPVYRLEVDLGPNTATTERVRFGNAVCSNGVGIFTGSAVFSHRDHNTSTDYALRQESSGDVEINAPANGSVKMCLKGTDARLTISPAGNVIIGNGSDFGGPLLQVNGDACKTSGGTAWTVCSDARLKENVRELEAGLAQLMRVRPVRFRYNGLAGTPAGLDSVGIIGQEMEKIFPEMIRRLPGRQEGEPIMEDLRMYDGSALTFVLVNAVKELAGKVEQLEQRLAEAHKDRGADGTAGWECRPAGPGMSHAAPCL